MGDERSVLFMVYLLLLLCIVIILLMFISDLFIKNITRISTYLQPYPFLTRIMNWLVSISKMFKNVSFFS